LRGFTRRGEEGGGGGDVTIQGAVGEGDPEGVAAVPAEMGCHVCADGLEDDGGDEAGGVLDGVGLFLVDGNDVGHEGGAVADHEGPV